MSDRQSWIFKRCHKKEREETTHFPSLSCWEDSYLAGQVDLRFMKSKVLGEGSMRSSPINGVRRYPAFRGCNSRSTSCVVTCPILMI